MLSIHRLAAWMLLGGVVLAIAGQLLPGYPVWTTGVLTWAACLLLAGGLVRRQVAIVLVLFGFGCAGIAWGTASGAEGLVKRALALNIPLIAMLIGVSFLRLISVSPATVEEPLSTGKGALARTLVGVHLFGAVINFSAVVIFADRLTARGRLTLEQTLALSQAFTIGALWSPFYGAMAVALIAAPGAGLGKLMLIGLPVTVVALLLMWLQLSSAKHRYAADFEGYPVHLEALWVPAVLAIAVLVAHEVRPAWPVLAIITIVAPSVTVLTLLVREGGRAWGSLRRLVEVRLPEMRGEIALFMAAAVLSAGVAGVIAALDLGVPFEHFGGKEASLLFAAMILLSWLGLHAVIMVSVVGPWLAPINPDPNLLAATFLMTWGVGLAACPMSNTLLGMQSRYDIPYREVLRHNRWYSARIAALCIVALNVYAALAI